MNHYPLQSGDAGAARLSLLASVHEQATSALFDAFQLPASPRCLDVGCGGGAVTELLATKFTRDGGSVLGVDIDVRYIELARARGAALGKRVAYESLSAHDLTSEREYDLVYSRFLLSHLREPREALQKILGAAKPGAVVAIEDVDFGGAFCHPPSPEFERYHAWYDQMTRGNGGDPNLGRSLFGMLSDLGVLNVALSVAQPTFSAGPGKQLAPTTLEHIGHMLVQKNIATAAELESTLTGLRSYSADPRTILSMPRVFQVWGRVS